jgi:hypothetical protein
MNSDNTCPVRVGAAPNRLVAPIETNVAHASTKVSRDVLLWSAFATKARLPSRSRAQ